MNERIVHQYLAGAAIGRLAREHRLPYATLHYHLTKIAPPTRRRGQREAYTADERFWKFVIPEPNAGCWLWLGSCLKAGYGLFYLANRQVPAHRAAWLLFRGEIPSGMEIDHRCRVRSCVNPDHLRLVTKATNLAQRQLIQPHCKRGHRLEPPNLMFERGARRCKQCRDEWRAAWLARRAMK